NISELKKKSKTLRQKTPVILLSLSGFGLSKISKHLRDEGYTEVLSLDGGFEAWKQAGLPVKKT
ncbi:MAG: hypothetical protein CBD16_00375, partial [Betaproteobacteria bacterium TMED156]